MENRKNPAPARRNHPMALRRLGLVVTLVWGMELAQGQEVPIEGETQLPVQSSLLPEREELLKQHAVGMIERLATGGADEVIEDFEEVMRRALPAAKLTSTWESVIASYGKVRSVAWQRTETRDDLVAIILAIRFEKGRLDSRIVYTSENRVTGWFFVAPGPWRDACYVDRSRFEEIELRFGPTWFPIRGTLSLPLGEGPFPAAILLHGSGPQDRDETIGGNKPFRDLAQGLASRGIAVLRFDKRTYSHGLALSVLLPRLTVKE